MKFYRDWRVKNRGSTPLMAEDNKMDLRLHGKIAIVTGGSGGIGHQIVLELAREGAHVVSLDIDPGEHLVEVARSQGLPGKILPLVADITQRNSVDASLTEIHRRFGSVEILVNNAGGSKNHGPVEDTTEETMRWNIALNIDGLVNCTLACGRDMLAQGRGSIVNISSNASVLGRAGITHVHYAGVKGFVNSFGRAIATEWGSRGIRVNTIAPGTMVPHSGESVPGSGSFWNRPEMISQMGKPEDYARGYDERMQNLVGAVIPRVGRPEDIADAVLFLASDRASYITGQIISVSGGGWMP
jgi:NAD(P)-dependent dehydrogenase (short-subunit alcohol dehydrogenase family)